MKYEPYKLDSFKELLAICYSRAWFSGEKTLLNIQMNSDFEGYKGRATEAWEQQFTLTSDEVVLQNGNVIPALNIKGETIEEVCSKALKVLNY